MFYHQNIHKVFFAQPTIFLLLRHVQIINKDDGLLAHWRTKHSLPTSVQFRHNNILGLVSASSGREVDVVGDVTKRENNKSAVTIIHGFSLCYVIICYILNQKLKI